MDLGLRGSVAFIAGATRGIGLAIAEAFAREGVHVIVTGRTAETLSAAVERLKRTSSDAQVLGVTGDMTKEDDIRRAYETGLETFGSVGSIVGNVGNGSGPLGWRLTPTDWSNAFTTNLMANTTLAAVVLPTMTLRRTTGSLTFVASIAGFEALSAPLPYGVAKAALVTAAKGLARSLGSEGIRVNAVAPGNIFFPGGAWARKREAAPDAVDAYIRTEVPMQRFGQPEEVADAVVFLASKRATFITGSCLVVDGGQTRSY